MVQEAICPAQPMAAHRSRVQPHYIHVHAKNLVLTVTSVVVMRGDVGHLGAQSFVWHKFRIVLPSAELSRRVGWRLASQP